MFLVEVVGESVVEGSDEVVLERFEVEILLP